MHALVLFYNSPLYCDQYGKQYLMVVSCVVYTIASTITVEIIQYIGEVVFNHMHNVLYSTHTAVEPVSVPCVTEREMDAPEQSHQGS